MHNPVVAWVVLAGFVGACGDGGNGPTPASDRSLVPDDSDVPEENPAPNDTEVPSGAPAPGQGQSPPGAPPPLGSSGSNCSRLCEHELRFSCDLDLPEPNCVPMCRDSIGGTRCGVELTAALLCMLDQGVCPEQEAAPRVCAAAIQRYTRCGDASSEAVPDDTLD